MAKRKRPEIVRIGSIDYTIKYKDNIQHIHTKEPLEGMILYLKSEIELSTEISKARFLEVLNHECLHGMFKSAGIVIPDDGEEDLIIRLAPVLTSYMRDNWKLLQKKGDLK